MTVKSPMIGSVSTGTMRTEDLMPAFADELSTLEMSETGVNLLADVEKFLGSPEALPGWDSEEAQWLMQELFDELDNHAPLHMRFGSHDGDGADFGFWPTDFDDCHRITIDQGKNGDHTFVDTECNLLVETNDHGNMTVKELGGKIIWDCV
tara:strand:+ start:959 stop:1411 length:453 start_codon:yes stop_codon:yes gene_type:complete